MTNPPYTARIHRRIDVLLIGLTIMILLLILLSSARAGSWAAWAGDRTSDRYVEEDSWWAERAAAFFPRYHFTLQASNLPSFRRDSSDGISAPDAVTAVFTWDGGGGDNNWSTANNWNPNGAPSAAGGHDLHFAGSTRLGATMEGNYTVNSLTFDAGAGSFALTSTGAGTQTLTLGAGGITNNSSNVQSATFEAITLGAAQTWTNNGGTMTINGPVAKGGNLLTVAGAGPTYITGVITGGGGLAAGSSDLILGTAGMSASSIGAISLSGGRLFINDSNAVAGSAITVTGGIVAFQGTDTTNANTISLASGTGLSNRVSAGMTLSGVALPTAGLLTLNQDDQTTYSLTVSNNLALTGNLTVQVGGGGGTVGTATLSGVISGSGWGITKTSTGTLTLSGANTYTGLTDVQAGTLALGSSNRLADTSTIRVSGGTFSIGGNDDTVAGVQLTSGSITGTSGGVLTSTTAFDLQAGSVSAILGGSVGANKTTAGTVTLSGANTYSGATAINGGTLTLSGASGAIASSSGITIGGGATLQLDNTTNNTNRIGAVTVTMNGGTFDFAHPNTGSDYTESVGQLSLSSGASTVSTDVASGSGGSSILTFASLARTAGATVNFGGGTSNPSNDNDNNNIRFGGLATGLIGPWATVGGTSFAYYDNPGGSQDSVEALASGYTDVTRLSSGTKVIANGSTNNVRIIDGSGSAANITLAAGGATINTLTNSATGGMSTINPNNQTLAVGGILNASGSGALTIGNGANNGTLTTNTSGGELVLHNYSSNDLTINSVIANNSTASSLTTTGTGTTVLTGANTYTGATTVNAGTLLVNGNQSSATGAVTVNGSGTTLGGMGTIGGSVSVGAGASLAPGATGNGSTAIFRTGALTLNSTSNFSLDLNGTTAGTSYDQLSVTGGVSIGGSNLVFNSVSGLALGNQLFILLNDSNDAITGTFAGLANGATVSSGGYLFMIDYFANGDMGGIGNDISLTVVPEPSTWVGGVLALAAIACTQRRRLRKLVRFGEGRGSVIGILTP